MKTKLPILLFLILFIFSCTNENLTVSNEEALINNLQNNLKLSQFVNKNISNNIIINWKDIKREEKEGYEIFELEAKEKDSVKINSKLFQKTLKYELITLKNNNTLYSYLIEAFSNTNGDLYPGTIKKLNNYSGTLNIFNLDGTLLGQLVINKGKILNPSNEKKIEPLENVIQLFYKPNKNSTTNKIPECNAFFVVKLITEYYVDRYEIWKYASTGEVFLTKYIGQVLVKTEVTYKNMAVAYPCDSEYGNDDIHIPYLSKNYQTVFKENADIIEEKIDDSQLDPCTKAIMEKLKNLTNSDIASIFEKFGVPVNGTYNLKIVLGTPDGNAIASTKPAGQNKYITTIRDTYIKGTYNNGRTPTDLSIATVIIHELIHAHFLALFDDYHNNGDICAYDNFTCLYENYVSKNYQGTIDAQHAQMFDNYIDKMASMLAEFKPGQSNGFYRDLAMSTMTGLKYFDDRYPEGSDEKSRITQSRLAEDNNEARGDILPKGTPCSK